MSMMDLEMKVYNAQYRLIKRECGEDAAKKANYGWGVDGDDEHISVATKVYGHGIIQSAAEYADRKVHHEWKDF